MSGDPELETTLEVPDENAQRKLMSAEDRAKLLASRLMYKLNDFDYTGARDALFYKTRCDKLGYTFPEGYYEAFALYDSGVRAKQYRSMLKKQAKKMRIEHQLTKMSFD